MQALPNTEKHRNIPIRDVGRKVHMSLLKQLIEYKQQHVVIGFHAVHSLKSLRQSGLLEVPSSSMHSLDSRNF